MRQAAIASWRLSSNNGTMSGATLCFFRTRALDSTAKVRTFGVSLEALSPHNITSLLDGLALRREARDGGPPLKSLVQPQ